MKDEIIKILKELLIEGYEFPPDCGREGRLQLVVLDEDEIDEVSDKIAGLFNQEVEKRISERMPSEEEIKREADLLYSKEIFIEACKWLRSRMTNTEGER